jgi:phosphatidylserine decarboxylase
MTKPQALPVWDRNKGKLIQEFSDDLASTYETRPGLSPTAWLESQPLYDWLVSAMQHSSRSAKNIQPFIDKHKIDMSEFQPVIYRSYAQFFTRLFKPGVRDFPKKPERMGAFAEARYFAWDALDPDQEFPIKGHSLNIERILNNKERSKPFLGGPVILARLAPMDYHHVHYFDHGRTTGDDRIGGRLWTVTWKALRTKPKILFHNERHINYFKTENFGRVAFVEIGAMTVGRIVQVHALDKPFERGEQKSFFNFGGSAIIMFGEKGCWRADEDIVQRTKEGVETFVRLGEPIASRLKDG